MAQQTVDHGVLADEHFSRRLPVGTVCQLSQGWCVATNAHLDRHSHLAAEQLRQGRAQALALGLGAQVFSLDPQAPGRSRRVIVHPHALRLHGQLSHQRGHQPTLLKLCHHIGPTVAQRGSKDLGRGNGRRPRLDHRRTGGLILPGITRVTPTVERVDRGDRPLQVCRRRQGNVIPRRWLWTQVRF